MLDRAVVQEFLEEHLEPLGINIPRGVLMDDLVEAFCQYTEDDYYEWLKDNFKSFFSHGDPDWKWIKKRIDDIKKMPTV